MIDVKCPKQSNSSTQLTHQLIVKFSYLCVGPSLWYSKQQKSLIVVRDERLRRTSFAIVMHFFALLLSCAHSSTISTCLFS